MSNPKIKIMTVSRLKVTNELFREQFDILYGHPMSETEKEQAEKRLREQMEVPPLEKCLIAQVTALVALAMVSSCDLRGPSRRPTVRTATARKARRTGTAGRLPIPQTLFQPLTQCKSPAMTPAKCRSRAPAGKNIATYFNELVETDGSAAVPCLIRQLNHGDPVVRSAASCALGQIHDSRAVRHLIRAASDNASIVRRCAVSALMKQRDRRAANVFMMVYNNQKNNQDALYALARIRDRRVIKPLLRIAKNPDDGMRYTAALFLVEMGVKGGEQLLAQVVTGASARNQQIAKEMIGRYGCRGAKALILDMSRYAEHLGIEVDDSDDSLFPKPLETRLEEASFFESLRRTCRMPTLIPLLRHKNWRIRGATAWAMGTAGTTEATHALLVALGAKNSNVRRLAAVALGLLKARRAAARLRTALRRDRDPKVRAAAAWALRHVGSRRSAPALIAIVKDRQNRWHRLKAFAAETLGVLKIRIAIPALCNTIAHSTDPRVRLAAVKALGMIGNRRGLVGLVKASRDGKAWIRNVVAKAMGALGDRRAVPHLLLLLKDREEDVQFVAAQSLAKIAGSSHCRSILSSWRWAQKDVRVQFEDTIAALCKHQSFSTLVKALKNEDPDLRASAATILGQARFRRSLPLLLSLLKDANYKVKEHAAAALGLLGDRRAIPRIVAELNSMVNHKRYKYIGALIGAAGKLKAKAAVAAIVKELDDGETMFAPTALKQIGDRRAVPALIRALDHYEPSYSGLGRSILEALLATKSDILPSLAIGLRHCSMLVRRGSAELMGQIKNSRAVPALIGAARNDPQPRVRAEAVLSLGKLKDPRAIPLLIKALNDPALEVRTNAARSLAHFRDGRTVRALRNASKNDFVAEVRDEATKAMKRPPAPTPKS